MRENHYTRIADDDAGAFSWQKSFCFIEKGELPVKKRKLNDLNLMDDFLINRIASDPEYGNAFVGYILATIFGRKMESLFIIPQKVEYGENTDKHGIRMDVYMKEGETGFFDLEVDQTKDYLERVSLPKRVRFYHAKIDVSILASNTGYDKLSDVCVIFIVDYDPFGLNRMVYTVRNVCLEEPDMPYEDGALSVFLYTKGTEGNPPRELKQLLQYMENTSEENACNEELRKIHRMVQHVKRKRETELAYMQLYEIVRRERRTAQREGREEGRVEGRAEDIVLILENVGMVPEELRKRIMEEKDEEKLKMWLQAAAVADSIEMFRKAAF